MAGNTVGNDCNPGIIDKWKSYRCLNTKFTVLQARNLLEQHLKNDRSTFVYLDPPYPKSSRRSEVDLYEYEMTDQQHRALLSMAVTVQFNCMISTYPNKLYDKMLSGWRKISFVTGVHGNTATELLYMNYEVPTELHDYRYIGVDCWDRQRIKRKINARVKTLSNLPAQERNAILHELRKL